MASRDDLGAFLMDLPETFGVFTDRVDNSSLMVPQNEQNFHDMSSYAFNNGQTENVYNGNHVPSFSTGLPSVNYQYGPLDQSYQQPLLSQRIPNFSNEPHVPPMVRNNIQEPPNLSLFQQGLQDQQFHFPMYQDEQFVHSELLLDQLKRIHETENQIQLPKFPEMPTPPTSSGLSPFTHTLYQPGSFAGQNSSSVNPPRRRRGRPRKNPIVMPSSLANTTSNLNPPNPTRAYRARDKGKQQVTDTTMHTPTLYNQYQNPQTNLMMQQVNSNSLSNPIQQNMESGGLSLGNLYAQFENEASSSRKRRIMLPSQERSVDALSVMSPWQHENMSSNGDNHNEKRLRNTLYDPRYARVGLHIDPRLRPPNGPHTLQL